MKRVDVTKLRAQKAADTAAKAVLEGKVLVLPTDTVYGLVADATNRKAVRKIFLIKGRERGKPLPIFVKDIAMAKRLAKIHAKQERLLKDSWPGKVTAVLESKGKLAPETGTQESVGLRIPNHELLLKILKKTGRPLTGTSANVAGKAPLAEGKRVVAAFERRKYKPDIVFDAGRLPFSRPSRVIDITTGTQSVLRK